MDANTQQQRRQARMNMSARDRARIMLTDSAASLAATFSSKGLETSRVDKFLVGWMAEMYAHGATPAFVVAHATEDAKKLYARAMAATEGRLPVSTGRRKQIAKRIEQPNMAMLWTVNAQDREQWRLALAKFIPQARHYKAMHNPSYTINLSKWVHGSVWLHISQHLLRREDKTKKGEPANDRAVMQYLLRQGPYDTRTSTEQLCATLPLAATQVQDIIQLAVQDNIISFRRRRMQINEPTMRVLNTARADDITRWQIELQDYIDDANEYRRRYDPNYQIDLQQWVQPAIWIYISEHVIPLHQRTMEGAPPNDSAVRRYLHTQQQQIRQDLTTGNVTATREVTDRERTIPRTMTARKSQRSARTTLRTERMDTEQVTDSSVDLSDNSDDFSDSNTTQTQKSDDSNGTSVTTSMEVTDASTTDAGDTNSDGDDNDASEISDAHATYDMEGLTDEELEIQITSSKQNSDVFYC